MRPRSIRFTCSMAASRKKSFMVSLIARMKIGLRYYGRQSDLTPHILYEEYNVKPKENYKKYEFHKTIIVP